MNKPSISFYTIGCRLNQSETAALQNDFEKNGFSVRPWGQPTDIVVINTCTVTENSDSDARRLVRRVARQNPCAEIALIGCQAQIHAKELAQWPGVRWVIGTARKFDLVSILAQAHKSSAPVITTPSITKRFINPVAPSMGRERTRANIKVQEGCDEFCSFCEVPYARGPARSRKFSDILSEATLLAEAGHKELVVTGVNIGKYSREKRDLSDVIIALSKITGIERVRLSSLEPSPIFDKILKTMAVNTKICRHLHVPIQSGSDDILKNMRRLYTAASIKEKLTHAVRIIPDICLGVDVIVGFPGETDRHFKETFEFLTSLPVHYFHVFSYSDRTMAKSRLYPQKVPASVIQKRSQILRALGQSKRQAFYRSMLGKTVSVLFEQKKGAFWTGLSGNFLHVRVRSGKNLNNKIVNVRLKKIDGENLVGQLTR